MNLLIELSYDEYVKAVTDLAPDLHLRRAVYMAVHRGRPFLMGLGRGK